MEEHAALNQKNKDGKTPLIIAAENSRLDNVKCLLRLGANPNHEPELHPMYSSSEYKQWLKTIETSKDISSKVRNFYVILATSALTRSVN